MLVLPLKDRWMLKKPLGILFPEFSDITSYLPGKMVCTVGDVVTQSALTCDIIPAIGIIDGFTLHTPYTAISNILHHTLHVKNPAGTITDELITVIDEAMRSMPCMILVDGEEDLAVLPLIGRLPDGALVLYGQPNEGVVVCKVTPTLRRRSIELLSCFIFT